MNDPNKVGLEIQSTYDGKGVDEARQDLTELDKEINKAGVTSQEATAHMAPLRSAIAGVGVATIATTTAVVGWAVAVAVLTAEQERFERQLRRVNAVIEFT